MVVSGKPPFRKWKFFLWNLFIKWDLLSLTVDVAWLLQRYLPKKTKKWSPNLQKCTSWIGSGPIWTQNWKINGVLILYTNSRHFPTEDCPTRSNKVVADNGSRQFELTTTSRKRQTNQEKVRASFRLGAIQADGNITKVERGWNVWDFHTKAGFKAI